MSFAWLLISWFLVGILCYFIVFKLGASSSTNVNVEGSKTSANNNPFLESYSTTDEKSKSRNASNWANAFINWIHSYSGIKFKQFHLELLNAIDDAARRMLHDEHYDLRIEKTNIEEGQIEPPEISDLHLTQGPVDQISGRAHIFVKRATIKLLTSKRKNDRFVVNNYEVLLTNINANVDLRIASIAGHTHLIICFSEVPTSEILLYDVEEGRVTGSEAVEIHDIITKAIGASIVNLKLESLISNNERNNYDFSSTNGVADVNDIVKRFYRTTDNAVEQNSSSLSSPPPLNKLHVSVIRAYDLNINNDSGNNNQQQQPFVVIEMDEPQRKYITSYGQSSSPNWNEGFDFDLSQGSDEILFEIYNPNLAGGVSAAGEDNTFLGLAIVGINELIKTNNPVQHLKLQGRPYHSDKVNGTLLVQFTFSYDPNVHLIGSHTNQIKFINRNGDSLSETTKHSIRSIGDSMGSNKNVNHLEPIPTKTTTVTVKGVQRPEDSPNPNSSSIYDSYFDHRDSIEPLERRQPSEEYSQSTIVHRVNQQQQSQNQQQQHQQHMQHHLQQQQQQQPGTPLTKEPLLNTPESKSQTFTYDHNEMPPYMNRPLADRRSGSEKRKRERSFFGDLKDRLTKKRSQYGRSKSADPATSPTLQETESYPPSRDQSQGPYGAGREYDDHARFSGDEERKCTLVLELQRAGETKYILIPPTIAREPAAASILKKGKKLHLCQNHTFVAVKSSCGISCNACNGKIASGFNKQAYQCRACRMVCHKGCHTHIQAPCINKNSMQLASAKDIDWAHYLRHSQLGEYISAENL